MRKKIFSEVMLLLIVTAILSLQPLSTQGQEGARHDEGLLIRYYAGENAAFTALLTGGIDVMAWPLTAAQYVAATATPDLQLAPIAELGMFQFDLNNNYTIGDYPGVRSPANDLDFRRALAHMVDKNWIVDVDLQGFGERIDCPLAAPQKGYANDTCCYDPYPYNIFTANTILDAAGYLDHDIDGWRNYPVGWDGAPDVNPADGFPDNLEIKICIRSDHTHRFIVGGDFESTIRVDCNIKTSVITSDSETLGPIVMEDRNYHIYTGGWTVGKYPTYLYNLFHSDTWHPNGANYVTGMNASNLPNYPDLDADLEAVYYADTYSSFVAAVKRATGKLVCDYCVNIPLWSYVSYMAYSKYLVGVVNMEGYGIVNDYTFMNAIKVDNPVTPADESTEPIKMGLTNEPHELNILYSSWVWDYQVLDRVYTSLMHSSPYNLAVDQPWIAQDWETSTWYDPEDDTEKTMVTYWLREDASYAIGFEEFQYTAWDVEFSIWYYYIFEGSLCYSSVKDVHHTEVVDTHTIKVYFDAQGFFLPQSIGELPLLSQSVFYRNERVANVGDISPLMGQKNSENFVGDGVTTTFTLTYKSLPHKSYVEVDGVHFREGNNYGIDYRDGYDLTFHVPPPPGSNIIVRYDSPLDIHGHYPGEARPEDILIGPGMYMATESYEGASGHIVLDCNPYFFHETPPLGEIDWTWYWQGIVKPRSGYYQVNLFDIVKLCTAFGSRGDGVPPPNWVPGADLDTYDLCHIGIYDAVTALVNYGLKHGIPVQQQVKDCPDEAWKYSNNKDPALATDPPVALNGDRGWLTWESEPDCTGHKMQIWIYDEDDEINCNEYYAAKYCDTYWVAKCPYDASLISTNLKYNDVNGDGKFTPGVDCFTGFEWVVKDNDNQDGDGFRDESVYEYDITNNKLKYKVNEYNPQGNRDNSEETSPTTPPTTVGGVPFSNGKHP